MIYLAASVLCSPILRDVIFSFIELRTPDIFISGVDIYGVVDIFVFQTIKTVFSLERLLTSSIWLYQINQYQYDGDEEMKGIWYTIPLARHPHAEPFSTDRHKTDLPQGNQE